MRACQSSWLSRAAAASDQAEAEAAMAESAEAETAILHPEAESEAVEASTTD